MRARQFVLHTHYSMYRRCPQRWRIATVATDTPPNLLPAQGLYCLHLQMSAHVRIRTKSRDNTVVPRLVPRSFVPSDDETTTWRSLTVLCPDPCSVV